MNHDIHVRRVWPLAPSEHARWEGGSRAVLAVNAFEMDAAGHVYVPTAAAPVVTIPKENVLAVTPRKGDE